MDIEKCLVALVFSFTLFLTVGLPFLIYNDHVKDMRRLALEERKTEALENAVRRGVNVTIDGSLFLR